MGSAMLKQKVADGTYKDHVLTKEVTTIGRSKENDIVVNDSSLSRLHIRVENRNGQFFVIDNNSSNGTFLNRHKITKAPLKHGDLLIAGRISFYFQQEQDLGVSKTQAMVAMEDPGATRIGMPVAMDVQAPPPSGIPPIKETVAGPTPNWQNEMPQAPPSSTMRAAFPDDLDVAPEHQSDPTAPTLQTPPMATPPGNYQAPTPPPFQSPFDPPATNTEPPQPPAPPMSPPPIPSATTTPQTPPAQAPATETAPKWDLPPIQTPAASTPPAAPLAQPAMASAGITAESPIKLALLRLVALIIDGGVIFVLMIPGIILQFLDLAVVGMIWSLLVSLVALAHPLVGWLKYGKTLGKHVLGLRIIDRDQPDNIALSVKAIIMRILGMMVSGMLFSLPYLLVLFDEEGRGLHDRFANTRVIKTR